MNPYVPSQNPYAAPQAPVMPAGYAPGPTLAHIEGQLLVVANGAQLPPVCLCCGATQPIEWRDQKFMYVPVWARFFGALIQVLVAKRSRFNLPLCAACNGEWRKWNIISALSWIPGLLLIFVGVACASADLDSLGGVLGVVGCLVLLVGLLTALILRRRRLIRATKIDKTHTWLRGVALSAQHGIVSVSAGAAGSYPPFFGKQ
jgi:hypothetical protein